MGHPILYEDLEIWATQPTPQAAGGPGYDAAGNIINDQVNQYLYDGEGRICAVEMQVSGINVMTGYTYDASGRRVGKGSISSMSCDPTVNGFIATANYVVGLSGEQLTELDLDGNGAMTWQHTNVYASGSLTATYDNNGLHFHLNDGLGTRRAQTNYAGVLEQTCSGLPFGDQLSCSDSVQFPTEQHFTGKERDTESGLDYFGARYYGSSMGRFMSPDPAGMMAADIEFPQSLNRYAYVWNNPLSFTDLNVAGTGLEKGGLDQNSSSGECGRTGGYWVDGGLTNLSANADQGSVQLTGTTNGTDQTHASYQDTSVYVGWYDNTKWNLFGHISMAFPGQTPVGFNPKSDAQFRNTFLWKDVIPKVPGAVKPQVGGQLKQTVRIPVSGMQAQMIQDAINQSTLHPGNYTLGEGNGCDCGTWAQQMLGDAGINTGSPARLPQNLMPQLQQLYPQQ
jgi:RHS repeat-associated protein